MTFAISHRAVVVLEHGRVVHAGSAQALRADAALIDRLIGAARQP